MANANTAFTIGFSTGGTPIPSVTTYQSGSVLNQTLATIQSGTTNVAYNSPNITTKAIAFYMNSDQPVTVFGNFSSGASVSGGYTFTLTPNFPQFWYSGNGPQPFFSGGLVSSGLFVFNSGNPTANFNFSLVTVP